MGISRCGNWFRLPVCRSNQADYHEGAKRRRSTKKMVFRCFLIAWMACLVASRALGVDAPATRAATMPATMPAGAGGELVVQAGANDGARGGRVLGGGGHQQIGVGGGNRAGEVRAW